MMEPGKMIIFRLGNLTGLLRQENLSFQKLTVKVVELYIQQQEMLV
jgi:hypothetical protein